MKVHSFIRRWVIRDPVRFQKFEADLISARLGITLERYLSRALIFSLCAGILFALLGYGILGVLLSGSATASQAQTGRSLLESVLSPQILVPLFLFLLMCQLTYIAALKYPGLQKKNRANRINLTLHNAVAYMYAMRKGGAQLMVIFRSLSENSHIYGEIAVEFRQIVRDADFFGNDVIHAVRHLMETTPSEKLKQFLEDMVSIIESGGDLAQFFAGRVRLYQEEARFEQKQFLNFLSLVAEGYVALFVAGPLFLIIIMVVMGMIGSGVISQMTLITYILLPIGSIAFIVLIDMISIKTERVQHYTQVKLLQEYAEVPIVSKKDEKEFFETLVRYDRLRSLREFFRHPFLWFSTNFNRTLYITIPVAVLYLAGIFLITPPVPDPEAHIALIDSHIVIAVLIVTIPYGVFFEIWKRHVAGIEALIPDFLDRMAGINKVGLTIAQAISIMVHTNLGLLTYEIRRIKRDMDWGANFSDALMRFEQRVSTPNIARSVTLITKASEMSGSIGEVLAIAANDAKMSDTLKRERSSEMFIYSAIVYLAFFVFLFVVAVLSTQFLPVLASIGTEGMPSEGAFAGINSVSIQTFHRIMYHACLVQAFFSGLIAGQMGESSLGAGLKHATVMLIASLILFNIII
ncbi:MAG: type II secretion system F family protein [Methanomicrobiales archaeon]|nr:type II secretion system F family protein [Methanomicrobiales archaeon]